MGVRLSLRTPHFVFCVGNSSASNHSVATATHKERHSAYVSLFYEYFLILFCYLTFLFLQHAIKCGAGSCAFLSLRSSGVYFVRDGRCSLWGSPYLDTHGEEDVLLDRGRPLYFDPMSYLLMTNAYLSHTLDDVIMQNIDGPAYKKPRPSHQL